VSRGSLPPHGLASSGLIDIDPSGPHLCGKAAANEAGGEGQDAELPRYPCVNRDREQPTAAGVCISPFARRVCQARSQFDDNDSVKANSRSPHQGWSFGMAMPQGRSGLNTTCMAPSPAIDAACSPRRGVQALAREEQLIDDRQIRRNAEGLGFLTPTSQRLSESGCRAREISSTRPQPQA